MIKALLLWHRRFAVLCAVPFIIWALSGLLHPAMSHFAKAERLKTPLEKIPTDILERAIPLQSVLIKNGIERFSHASIVEYAGRYYYQIKFFRANMHYADYFSVLTGQYSQVLDDAHYARYLAQKWSGESVLSLSKITAFDSAYARINRILPVYKVTLANKNHVYIDTLGKRVAAHNTPLRERLSFWFKQLHTFEFIGGQHDVWRIIPMLVISILLLLTALFGLISYGLLWKRLKSKRINTSMLHRTSGLTLSICMLGFASSSSHILVDKFFPQTFRTLAPDNINQTRLLDHNPALAVLKAGGDNFQLVTIDDQIYTQVVTKNKRVQDFTYWQTHQTSITDVDVATSHIANQIGDTGTILATQKVDKFGPTYGFVNKRLPVIQVRFVESPDVLYSVEAHTGFIANIDDQWQKARSWHFGYLHKYHFLNPLGKEVRDIIITFICVGLVLTAGLGMGLYISRRKRLKRAVDRRDNTLSSSVMKSN